MQRVYCNFNFYKIKESYSSPFWEITARSRPRERTPAICALELRQRLQLQSQATAQCSACFIGHFLNDSACWLNARRLIHFVDIEAIFPFSEYKCKYLVVIEGSSLLATSNKRWNRLNLLDTVHSALPNWLSQATLLCHKKVAAVVRERRPVRFARKRRATIQ